MKNRKNNYLLTLILFGILLSGPKIIWWFADSLPKIPELFFYLK